MGPRFRPFLIIVCRILRHLVVYGSECSWWKLCSSSNLNPRVFRRYIESMVRLKLLIIEAVSSRKRIVRITQFGFNLVKNVDAALESIGLGKNLDPDTFR